MVCCIVLAPGARAGVSDSDWVYSDITDPSAAGLTVATGVNSLGQIAGYYTDSSGGTDSFVYSAGSFTPLNPVFGTFQASGISDSGTVAGTLFNNGAAYGVTSCCTSTVSVPSYQGTYIDGISSTGGAVAGFVQGATATYGVTSLNNYVAFSIPSATSTVATGINTSGEVAGFYYNASGTAQGFTMSGSTITTINAPQAALGTYVTGINNSGALSGYFIDSSGASHGFVDINGTFTTLNDPSSGNAFTVATGISNSDTVVGYYVNQGTGQTAGFVSTNLASTNLPSAVPISSAGPASNAYLTGSATSSSPGSGSGITTSFQNLELLPGSAYTLNPADTISLNSGTGTLYVDQGAVFSGNGTVNGNILNSGLVRIPIVALTGTSGGYVQLTPTNNVITAPSTPVYVNPNTYVAVGGGAGGGFGGGGGGGGGGGIPSSYTIVGNAPIVNGTFAFDASLAVTGYYEQTSTGSLRLFVGGHDAGVDYSQLNVGQTVSLDGTVEVVLEPDLFGQFDYTPQVGDTFDFITSVEGITLSPTLQYEFFVTQSAADLLSGYDLTPYASGIASDPDSLFLINDPGLFSFALIDGGTVLQATLEQPLSLTLTVADVPEPATIAVLLSGFGALGWMRHRRPTSRHRSPY